jgi:hypothetical protein
MIGALALAPPVGAAPPAIYAKSIAPLLTPVEEVLAPAAVAAPAAGEILLAEEIHFVGAEGAYYRVERLVARGAPPAAFRYLPSAQQIQPLIARRRVAGGAWQEDARVETRQDPEEAFAELAFAFPESGPDTFSEVAVLVEENVLPIPGELTALLAFYGDRGAALCRAVVELPAAMAARLQETPVGAAPAARRQPAAGGRWRFEWRLEGPPPGRSAAVWLTTLESWDRLADWYRGQLAGRLELPAELAAEAKASTAAAKDRREAAAILYRRVADGLAGAPSELGLAPALPRRPAEVWSSGRGDSLDKAQLLRALLAAQGIESTLALVNSRQAGAIETRSPDFRQFDRALLAIELEPGKSSALTWADPSLPFLELGQLGPGDGRRPAFLIPAAGGWRFATTPAAAGTPVSPEMVAELARRPGAERLEAAILAALAGPGEPAAAFGELVRRLEQSGEEGVAGRLYLTLEKAAAERQELRPVTAELRRLFEAKAAVGRHAEIARGLAEIFAKEPPSFWAATPLAGGADAAAAAARLAELEEAKEIAPFLRQAVFLLTTFPPGEDFSRRLYQVSFTFAESYPEAPQVEKLLGLLARLPKTDANFWEGQAIAGRRLSAGGQANAALALYRRQLADPALLPGFVAVFKALSAEAELAAGRVEAAEAAYSELRGEAGVDLPILVDALVQAALLELEAGRPEAALEHLQRLSAAEPAVVERSASPQQALYLRQLGTDEKRARRAWASAGDWWPSWLELEARWPAPPGRPVAPLLGDLQLLGARFGDDLARGDRAAAFEILRRLAYAARWDPQLALELSGSLVYLVSTRPDLAEEIHQTAIILHRALPPFAEPEAAARSRLLLAAHLIDAGRPAEALEPLRDLLALKVGGMLEQRGLTLLAMVALATGRGEEQAAAELARSLSEGYTADGFPAELRGVAALRLAELYQRLGRPREERQLLEKEATHPAVVASPQRAELVARLEALRKGSDLFAESFAAWRQQFEMPILAAAEPASLADERLAGKAGLQLLEGGWLPPEKVKIAFLAAADAKRGVEERAELLAAALPELRACLPRQGIYRRMLESLAQERRFPALLRSSAAFYLVYSQIQHENLEAADALLRGGGLELSPQQRKTLESLRALPAAKAAGGAGLEAYFSGLLAKKLSPLEEQLLPEAWRYLMLLGAAGATERLDQLLDGLRLEDGSTPREAELRRGLRESRAELEALRRDREGWRQLWLFEAAPARPELVGEIANPRALEALPPAECRALLLYDLETLELGLAATPSWPAHFAACQEGGAAGKIQAEIVLAVAGGALGDGTKAEALAEAAGYLADDDPAWPGLLEGLRRKIDPQREKRAGRVVTLLAAQRALRRGETVDWRALRGGADAGQKAQAGSWQARWLLSRGDAAGARSLLAEAPEEELENPTGMLERLQLLALSPGPERKKVAAAARRHAYLAKLAALANDSWSAARQAIRLEAALGESSEPAWAEGVAERTGNELGKLSLELALAEAGHDWPAAYAAAKKMIEIESPDHDDLFSLGRAAFETGQKEEAQAVLRLFLEKTRHHPAEKGARRLLERLASP